MSQGLNRAFLRDPKAFMRTHVIQMAWGNLPARNNQQVIHLDFDLVPIAAGTNACYLESYTHDRFGQPKAHGPNSHPIHAYWLPYEANKYCETTLGNAADFMFTATLTGCTLGVGSGANPKVSHINYQAGPVIDQNRILQKFNKHYMHDVFARSINQNDYWLGVNGQQAHTVVGIRRGNEWKFYLNSRQGNGAAAQLLVGKRKI